MARNVENYRLASPSCLRYNMYIESRNTMTNQFVRMTPVVDITNLPDVIRDFAYEYFSERINGNDSYFWVNISEIAEEADYTLTEAYAEEP